MSSLDIDTDSKLIVTASITLVILKYLHDFSLITLYSKIPSKCTTFK